MPWGKCRVAVTGGVPRAQAQRPTQTAAVGPRKEQLYAPSPLEKPRGVVESRSRLV